MSAMWKGNLLNSDLDIFIDSTLLLLIPMAYSPQLIHSNRRISPYYVLFTALTANAQLSEALLSAAYAWPTSKNAVLFATRRGDLSGIRAYGGMLGLLQIFSQWSCALLQAAVLKGYVVVALLHAAAVVLPALALACRPALHGRSLDQDIQIAFINMSNLVVAPCFIALQLYAQRTSQGLRLPLFLQALVFALLAVRWWLRLGIWTYEVHLPPDLPLSERISLWREFIQYIYTWGYPSINFAMQSIVCIVLLCYRSENITVEETQPLLR